MTKRTHSKSLFILTVAFSTGLGAMAFADSHKGRHKEGGKDHMMHMMHMMQKMQNVHDRMHGHDHAAMMGKHGMMGGMRKMLDADGDGQVTPEEAAEQLQAKLEEFDADGDGSLSIAEFEALHSAIIREKMVDRFQHLDADGDGQITPEEMNAPADEMQRMQRMRRMMHSGGMSGQQGGAGMGQTQDDAAED